MQPAQPLRRLGIFLALQPLCGGDERREGVFIHLGGRLLQEALGLGQVVDLQGLLGDAQAGGRDSRIARLMPASISFSRL